MYAMAMRSKEIPRMFTWAYSALPLAALLTPRLLGDYGSDFGHLMLSLPLIVLFGPMAFSLKKHREFVIKEKR